MYGQPVWAGPATGWKRALRGSCSERKGPVREERKFPALTGGAIESLVILGELKNKDSEGECKHNEVEPPCIPSDPGAAFQGECGASVTLPMVTSNLPAQADAAGSSPAMYRGIEGPLPTPCRPRQGSRENVSFPPKPGFQCGHFFIRWLSLKRPLSFQFHHLHHLLQ